MRWTKKEIGELKRLYGTMLPGDIGKRLKRSEVAIRRKCSQIGLRHRKQREWSFDETSRLKKWYGERSIAKIARELGRTHASIIGKAQRLGLVESKRPWTVEEMSKVELLYETHTAKEIAELLGRTENSVASMRSNLGLYKGPSRIVDEDTVKTMLTTKTVSEIAQHFNVDPGTISSFLRRRGWQATTKSPHIQRGLKGEDLCEVYLKQLELPYTKCQPCATYDFLSNNVGINVKHGHQAMISENNFRYSEVGTLFIYISTSNQVYVLRLEKKDKIRDVRAKVEMSDGGERS